MTNNERKRIITAAIELINLLEDCDDMDFVDAVIECVSSDDIYSLEEDELPY